MSRKHAEQRKQRRYIVAERGLDYKRIPVRISVKESIAGICLTGHIVGRLIADLRQTSEFLMAVARHMNYHQPGVYLEQLTVMNAELIKPDHVLDKNITALDKPEEYLFNIRIVKVKLKRHRQAVSRILHPR